MRWALPLLVGCASAPPRTGTQIGVEESGACRDVQVFDVASDEIPEGASRSLEEVSAALLGRFASEDNVILEVSADLGDVQWVEQEPAGGGSEGCPPLWRVSSQPRVYGKDLGWVGAGTLELWEEGQAFLVADGVDEPNLPPPRTLDEVSGTRLYGHGSGGNWSVDLMWRGAGSGDVPEETALHATMNRSP